MVLPPGTLDDQGSTMNTTFNNVPDVCSLPALFLFICPHLIAFPLPPSLSEPFQEDTTHQNRQRVIAILDPEAAAAAKAAEAEGAEPSSSISHLSILELPGGVRYDRKLIIGIASQSRPLG